MSAPRLATLMQGRRVHPKIVPAILDRSTVAVTLDLYSHVIPTIRREATAATDGLRRRDH